MQVDTWERGFSYAYDAPLDMRMDPAQLLTAAEVVNTWDERRLARLLREYGEERYASQIARAIGRARRRQEFASTQQLVDAIKTAVPVPAQFAGGHPAKRTFQALRIAVNDELDAAGGGAADRLGPARHRAGGWRRSPSTRWRTGWSSASSPRGHAAASARRSCRSASADASRRPSSSPVAPWLRHRAKSPPIPDPGQRTCAPLASWRSYTHDAIRAHARRPREHEEVAPGRPVTVVVGPQRRPSLQRAPPGGAHGAAPRLRTGGRNRLSRRLSLRRGHCGPGAWAHPAVAAPARAVAPRPPAHVPLARAAPAPPSGRPGACAPPPTSARCPTTPCLTGSSAGACGSRCWECSWPESSPCRWRSSSSTPASAARWSGAPRCRGRTSCCEPSVARLSDEQRIERLAAQMGMVMPRPDQLRFVRTGAGSDAAGPGQHPRPRCHELPRPAAHDRGRGGPPGRGGEHLAGADAHRHGLRNLLDTDGADRDR